MRCKKGNIETSLRDYFFQAGNEISKIENVDVTISKYENKYIVKFSNKDVQFDVETNGLSQNQMVKVIKEILRGE